LLLLHRFFFLFKTIHCWLIHAGGQSYKKLHQSAIIRVTRSFGEKNRPKAKLNPNFVISDRTVSGETGSIKLIA
jgi:hypothetical protein